MYVLEFVNRVRDAQSCAPLAEMPDPGADGSTALELAMGCRLETERCRRVLIPVPLACRS